MEDRFEPLYTRRNGFLHVALMRHRPATRETSIIATGKFPDNCPKNAIREWIERISRNSVPASSLVPANG